MCAELLPLYFYPPFLRHQVRDLQSGQVSWDRELEGDSSTWC